jgi:hypothetical protein
LILGGAAAGAPPSTPGPAPVETTSISPYGPPAPAPVRNTTKAADGSCHPQDARDIVVCAQRRQGYRLNPSVMDAERRAEQSARSATSAPPAAQASCAASPMGCGTGLEGLDLANVAVVVGAMAVKAAKGEDWKKAFRQGPDEYQLYLQARHQRDAREAERAEAAAVKVLQNR